MTMHKTFGFEQMHEILSFNPFLPNKCLNDLNSMGNVYAKSATYF